MDIGNANTLIYTTVFLIGIPLLLKLYFKRTFSYWKNRNVPYFEPRIPLGNISLSFGRKYGQDLADIYRKFKNIGAKYGGFFMSTKPVFLPIDPEIIKLILTKDFASFEDRGYYVNEEKEILTAHLLALHGERWKILRAKMSPTVSPNKIKLMFDTMKQCGQNLEEAIASISDTPINVRDLCCRFSVDVIGSVGFGVECCSLKDPSVDFLKYGTLLFENTFLQSIKLVLGMTWPSAMRALNLQFIKSECANFFIKAIKDVVEYRNKNEVERNDMLNMLMRLMNKKDIDDGRTSITNEESITMNELIAQCFVFYMAGFETSATTIQYCMFELAQNADLQQKVREEIRFVKEKHNGQFSYEAISEMLLLDKVLYETMRKHPAGTVLNRKCTKDYTIPETNVTIAKGTSVFISVYGIHHDPEYYPEPDKFDPERFSEEEKRKRPPYTYIPFGEGPKNCLGIRLAMTLSKFGVASMLADYQYSIHPNTKLPLEYKSELMILTHYGTIWLQAKKIQE